MWINYRNGGKIKKKLTYNHPAINDENQDLCNGWFTHPSIEFEEVDRVLLGLKPMGISHSSNLDDVKNKAKECEEKGFLTSYTSWKGTYALHVSPRGKLRDFFDMDAIAKEYQQFGLTCAVTDILKNKETDFEAFHNDKYGKHGMVAITGLILGYPIENTISLMLYS